MDEKLIVFTGTICNNSCIFCEKPKRAQISKNTNEIISLLFEKKQKGYDYVEFTGGEPTLRKDLVKLVKSAKLYGYKTISMMTNGRMLSNKNYAKEIVDAGINLIVVSIHGHNFKVHQELTRGFNGFNQTMDGIKNLHELDFYNIGANCVVNKLNYQYVIEIAKLFRDLRIKKASFSFVNNNKNAYFLPTYQEVIPKFSELVKFAKDNKLDYNIKDYPLCLLDKKLFNKTFYTSYPMFINDKSKNQILIKPLKKCELKCNFCYEGSMDNKPSNENNLDIESFEKIINKMRKESFSECIFYGCEITYWEGFDDAIEMIKKNNIKTSIFTNAIRLLTTYDYKSLNRIFFDINLCSVENIMIIKQNPLIFTPVLVVDYNIKEEKIDELLNTFNFFDRIYIILDACEINSGKNIENFNKIKKLINKKNISIIVPVPLCMFSDDQIKIITKSSNIMIPKNEKNLIVFDNNLMMNYSLFTKTNIFIDLTLDLSKNLNKICFNEKPPIMKKCKNCVYFNSLECVCGSNLWKYMFFRYLKNSLKI